MRAQPGTAELSIRIDLDQDERFLIDYRSNGERIEVKNLRAFIDLYTGKFKDIVVYGFGIRADGTIGSGRSKKVKSTELPENVREALFDSWDERVQIISDVEELV